MQIRARLVTTCHPPGSKSAVLVLHGGASRRSLTAVSPVQLSVLRMIPIAKRIARAGRGRIAVFRLLNSARGWDSEHTPVDDALWALTQVRERLGQDVSTCLVGHSLGGRAALLAAREPQVRSVVALAPFVYATDGQHDLTGRRVLFVHGMRDRIAAPSVSAEVAGSLADTAEVGYIRVPGGNHALLRQHRTVDRYAGQFSVATLLGEQMRGAVARAFEDEHG